MITYLMIDKGNHAVKVGHTADIFRRMLPYATANPFARLAGYVVTRRKTHTALEHIARAELLSLGGRRVYAHVFGLSIRTEWIDLTECPELLESLQADSLQALRCCKGRKIYR